MMKKKLTQFKSRLHKPYLISDQNAQNRYPISDRDTKKQYPLEPHIPI